MPQASGGGDALAGFAAWAVWIVWRFGSSVGPIGVVVLGLEVAAFICAVVIALALWNAPPGTSTARRDAPLPELLAAHLGLTDLPIAVPHGADDTGEIAMARHGLRVLDLRHRADRRRLAWAIVTIEGLRRMLFVVMVVVVLVSGRVPFGLPSAAMVAVLVASQVLVPVAQWLLSGGVIRPGARFRWSMATIGAGLGDGTSRTGLPIRWTTTMATMIVLNLAVALRGLSDRWTHGLGPMPHDERVVTMLVSWSLVLAGFAALRTLPKPSLGFYGATGRLEETSTRRLALGTTLAIAALGFVVGALPGGLPA